MTAQETFDLVSLHLLTQNSVCKNASEFNTYAHDGSHSAIGAYLKKVDPTYLSQIDSTEPENLTLTSHRDLLLELENVHDRYQPDEWLGQLHAVAKLFGLSFQGITYRSEREESRKTKHTFSLTFKVRSDESNASDVPNSELFAAARRAIASKVEGSLINTYSQTVTQEPFAITLRANESGKSAVITLLAYDEDDAINTAEGQVIYGDVVSVKKISWETYNELQAIAA